MPDNPIFTVGHSNLPLSQFLGLLRRANITALADVRSSPQSRWFPHFDKHNLKKELPEHGIQYVYLGRELGGRPLDPSLFEDGTANYEVMARSGVFGEGIRRVIDGSKKYRIALMCSEHDPLDCHRCLLIGRQLASRGLAVIHILSDGRLEEHRETERRLLEIEASSDDLFMPAEERLAFAYRKRSRKVAYSEIKYPSDLLRKVVG
jgi:uncharacterized protein (DUF488 family)